MATTTTTEQSQLPAEYQPYVKDILEQAQQRYEAEIESGYQPYKQQRIARFDPYQTQAQKGIASLAQKGLASDPTLASSKTYAQRALSAADASKSSFTPSAAQQYMSPYMQSVVDSQKEEARRDADIAGQQLAAGAVTAGGFGGSRHAIAEAEAARNLQDQLGDIQTTGLQSAYEQAQKGFEDQKDREMTASKQYGALGTLMPQQAMQEQQALMNVGAQKQQQAQQALDYGYQQFQEEQAAPDVALAKYSGLIHGSPYSQQYSTTQTQNTGSPNFLSQLAGVGTGLVGLAGAFDWFNEGGKIGKSTKVVQYNKSTGSGTVGSGSTTELKDMIFKRFMEPKDYTSGLKGLIEEGQARKREQLELDKQELEKDKWLELARLGAGMMAAGGEGDNVFTALGKAAPSSIDALRELKSQERDINSALSDGDIQSKLKLAQLEQSAYDDETSNMVKALDLLTDASSSGYKTFSNFVSEGSNIMKNMLGESAANSYLNSSVVQSYMTSALKEAIAVTDATSPGDDNALRMNYADILRNKIASNPQLVKSASEVIPQRPKDVTGTTPEEGSTGRVDASLFNQLNSLP